MSEDKLRELAEKTKTVHDLGITILNEIREQRSYNDSVRCLIGIIKAFIHTGLENATKENRKLFVKEILMFLAEDYGEQEKQDEG